MDARTYPAKETPKSRRTRARILDAAMRLFAEVGYHAATNAMIADAANLTRGAMLYHFASREELVEAAVAHIDVERARLFEQVAAAPPAPGVDAAEHAIDVAPRVTVDDDLAATFMIFIAVLVRADGSQIANRCTNSQVWRRTSAGWRIIRDHTGVEPISIDAARRVFVRGSR